MGKKRISLMIISLALVAITFSYLDFHQPRDSRHIFPQGIANIAHRGGLEHTPENTHAAFQLASQHAAILELDTMFSKDGTLVVIHDYDVNRTTNGQGKVSHKTLDELMLLDAGSHFSDKFKHEKLPLLEDVLVRYGQKMFLAIEIKSEESGEAVEKLAHEFVRLIKKHNLEKRVIICSFNPFTLNALKRINPNILRAQLYSNFVDEDIPWYQKVILKNLLLNRVADPDILQVRYTLVDAQYVKEKHELGYLIQVWTVNDADEMKRLIRLGVDGIITDKPQLLNRVMTEVNAEKTNIKMSS